MGHLLRRVLLAAPLAMALAGCGGQRLLTIEILQDGKVVLSGIRGVPDSTPVDPMWNELDDLEFESSKKLPGDDEGSDATTLAGESIVRIRHTDNVLAEKKVSDLKLTKVKDKDKHLWKLADGEADRVRKAKAK